jgi:hypothetical protein
MLGYKPKVTGVATATIDIYQKVPAKSVGGSYAPDYDYALVIGANTVLSSNVSNFLIQDPVDFTFSSSANPTEVSILTLSGTTPLYYLLKKSTTAISANIVTKTFSFGAPQRFQTIEINDTNIIKILDITGSNGDKWYEVPYLAQEMIYDSIANAGSDSGEVPYLLQLTKMPRRFVSRFTSPTTLQIQFGAGTTTANVEEEIIPNPTNVGNFFSTNDYLTTAYDPANFLYTSTYGIAPSNTTLRVRYLTGGGVTANAASNTINRIVNSNDISFKFENPPEPLYSDILGSVAVTNPFGATGGQDGDTPDELKFNSLGTFGTQLRTVTQDDYIVRALSMPSQYGSLAKVYAEPERL